MNLVGVDAGKFINNLTCEPIRAAHHQRKGNTMTMTTTANPRATLDTVEGTVVRLVGDKGYFVAPIGSLAFVGDGTAVLDANSFLDITWARSAGGALPAQMDGGYIAEDFEVCEFQIGDRVRVKSLYPRDPGHEGVITGVPGVFGDDCMVAYAEPAWNRDLSHKFSSLEKVAKEETTQEIVNRIMQKLYGDTLVPLYTEEPKKEFAVGDIAVIDADGANVSGFYDRWNGRRFPVKSHDGHKPQLADGVIDNRVDGFAGDFFFGGDNLRAFDPARDFKVGDKVVAPYYGHTSDGVTPAGGIVTDLEPLFGGNIMVDWTQGPGHLALGGGLGCRRANLTLVSELAADKAVQTGKPFVFEAGQEIGSSDVLADLPAGTVVYRTHDQESPIVKLVSGNFGRINRYATPAEVDFQSVSFEDADLAQLTDGGNVLMIGFVPAESN